jgi:RNA polymerase sigma-70 factor (ECF subfamily)
VLNDDEIRTLLLRTAARDSGSAAAFERLYKLAAPLMLGVAKRIVGRNELAEEILHDAFSRVWHGARTFDPLGRPVSWMVAIVRNRAIDEASKHDVSRVSSFVDAFPEEADRAVDRLFDWSDDSGEREDGRRSSAWLKNCLERLQASERQAIVLAFQHGMSHRELAARLRKPLGTVKSWIRRGMRSLRDCIEACMQGAG